MDLESALKIFNLNSLEDQDQDSLKKLYYKLAKEKHPDKKEGSEKEFVKLREGYLLLSTELDKTSLVSTNNNRSLAKLSKEEILDRYYHDTKDLQLKLEEFKMKLREQTTALNRTKKEAEEAIVKFEINKQDLKINLDKEIQDLEQKFNTNFIQKLLFFLPRMSQEEFWIEYHKKVKKYSKKDMQVDMEFFQKMLNVYGAGLNEISEHISESLEK
jgi:DnaJ domain